MRIQRFTADRCRAGRAEGFTLLELMMAVGLAAVLAILAVGQLNAYLDRARSAAARGDIAMLETMITRYRSDNGGALPDNLGQVAPPEMLDPWKRPYHYTRLEGIKGKGAARKDRKLNPLNTDYDLFSAGKDGVFKTQISQKDSLDDVIRVRDGAFIGLAADF